MNLPKIYEPEQYEQDIYQLWEATGAFQPQGEGEPYSIIMPPPNANAPLHTGHGLYVIQDILTRYHRMQGKRALYLPGADHAGFETWVVYERYLESQGSTRFNYSRDELYSQVWDFVANNRGVMEKQLRQLGLSCDWSKLTFTLDPNVVATAYRTFEKMWNEGLIYRGKRLVNYCTKHQTSFADIEIEYKDAKTPLYYMKYGPFELATTRPETKFGDTAVAVHPDDERYKKYVGSDLEIEGVNGPFTVKVVADSMVDTEFGTGVVKITPAHDFNDWDVAQRHNLPAIEVIDQNGKMTEKAGQFEGMTVTEAREAVVEALKEKGLLLHIDEEYRNRVGHCYKCGTVIEPMLMDQWFIKVRPLAERAVRVIEKGEIKFTPENKGRILIDYLNSLRDWNISRQIPWGIPIPAFQNTQDESDWIFDISVDQETIEKDGKTYKRDPDTFDTWFSSGQWPFITTLFSAHGDLEEFYPTSVMETGHDILYPWVSRMIMLGLYVTDQVPFKDVYLHGLVLDPQGQKMSKSKGNVVNPIEIVAEYGSDATRIGLISSRSAGQNQAFGPDKVLAGRNFCNKLWNIARYVESAALQDIGQKTDDKREFSNVQPTTPADHWIIRELVAAKQDVAMLLEEYRFAEAFETVYHTIWDKVADWYIESSKTAYSADTMAWVLEASLIMAHPFAPFVTETIWQTLDWHPEDEDMLITTKWQLTEEYDETKAAAFEALQQIITETRGIITEINTKDVALLTTDSLVVEENASLLRHLARVGLVEQVEEGRGLRLTGTHEHVWLDLSDEEIARYKAILEKKRDSTEKEVAALEHRLSNESYVKNAPEELVAESREALTKKASQLEHLRHQLKHL